MVEPQKTLMVRMPRREFDELHSAATLAGRTVSSMVREAVGAYLQAISGDTPPGQLLRQTRSAYASSLHAALDADPYQDAVDRLAGGGGS